MSKYIFGTVLFFVMFTIEEYRITQRDIQMMHLKWEQPDVNSTLIFTCVKCNAVNTRSLFQFSDSIQCDSSKIFKNIQ